MFGEHLSKGPNDVSIRFPDGGANPNPVKLIAPVSTNPFAATPLDFGVDESVRGVMYERQRLASFRCA